MTNNSNGKIRNDSSAPVRGLAAYAGVSMIFTIVFLIPFIVVGITTLIKGIAAVSSGDTSGSFVLIFAIFWNLILVIIIISMIRNFLVLKKTQDTNVPLTADYPKAEYPKAEYPKADYPDAKYPEPEPEEQADKQSFFSSFPSVGNSTNVDYDDEDYKDMKRRGYE